MANGECSGHSSQVKKTSLGINGICHLKVYANFLVKKKKEDQYGILRLMRDTKIKLSV